MPRTSLVAAVVLLAGTAHAAPDDNQVLGLVTYDDAPPARRQLAIDLSAGGGADTTAPHGFFAARASLDARIERPASSIFGRGLHLADPTGEEEGDLWIFTGLEPVDHNGIGVTGDANLHLQPDADLARELWLDGRAWARAGGWQLEVRGAYQPVGDLRDAFWRSGRGVMQTATALEIPPMWAIGTHQIQLLVMGGTVDLGKRTALVDGMRRDAGWDRDVRILAMRVQTAATHVDVLDMHYAELGVAQSTAGLTEYGTSATVFDIDAARVAHRFAGDVTVTAQGGVVMRMPVAPYQLTGTTESSTGPVATTPSYSVEIQHGRALDPYTSGATQSLTLGSWTRLDPTGHAVDAGQLATASADWRDRRYRIGGELQLGRLRRILLGDQAPAGLIPAGTKMIMGRAQLLAAYAFTNDLAVTTTAWLERSDRDDPRWLVPSTGALATHAGADLTAQWQFRHL